MAHLLPWLEQQFEDANGLPLAGGKLYFYEAGTSTPLATYTDQSEDTPAANPVILDANGKCAVWIGASAYKVILTDSNDVEIFSRDNVTHLGNGSVTEPTIAEGAVTTSKYANKSVTPDKMADLIRVRQSLTIDPVSSTTPEVVTGTLNVTTTGRPVHVSLIGQDAAGTPAFFKVAGTAGQPLFGIVDFYRGVTKFHSQKFGINSLSGTALLAEFDTAGTDSYTVLRDGVIILEGAGGGGGGAGGGGSGGGGGGGGGSYHPPLAFHVTVGEVLTVVIGAKGTGSAGGSGGAASAAGVAGGVTTVTSDLQGEIFRCAGGGGGGGVADGSSAGSAGGAAGIAGSHGGAGGAGGNDAQQNGGSNSSNGSAGSRAFTRPVFAGGLGGSGGNGNAGFGGGAGGGGSSGFGSGGLGGNKSSSGGQTGTSASATAYGAGGGGGGGGDNGSAGGNGGNGADGYIAIYDPASSIGGTLESVIPVTAFQTVDYDAPSGTHNYTIQLSVSDEDATLTASGTVSLEVRQL